MADPRLGLNHWSNGAPSLQGGQIPEWVPIISSVVGVHMELLDQTQLLPTLCQDNHVTLTRPCPTGLDPVSEAFTPSTLRRLETTPRPFWEKR